MVCVCVGGGRSSVVGWALSYKPKGRGFDFRWLGFSIYLILPSRTMALGSPQPLAEVSTWNLPAGKGRPARKADLTAIYEPIV
jgi:hypothetical protein